MTTSAGTGAELSGQITWLNGTGSDVAVNEIVDAGNTAAVAAAAIADTESGLVETLGTFEVAKSTSASTAFVAGGNVYDIPGGAVAANAGGATGQFLGIATEAAADSDAFVNYLAQPYTAEGPRYVTAAAAANTTLGEFAFKSGLCVVDVPNTTTVSIILPAIADVPNGAQLIVTKTTSDAQAITIDANASEEIDGSTTLATADAEHDTHHLVACDDGWRIVSSKLA